MAGSVVPLLTGVMDVPDTQDVAVEDVAVEVVDVEKDEDEDAALLDAVLLDVVSAPALVMTKTSVAESVSWVPSSQTAMENRGEAERSLVVPTIQVKLVAPTWSSAEWYQSLPFLACVQGETLVRVINSKGPSVEWNCPLKLAAWVALSW